jgi:muskelin
VLDTSQVRESNGDEDIAIAEEPQPRYAHQVVYDEGSKTVFLHGGNAGLGSGGEDGMERASEQEDQEEKPEEDGERARSGRDGYGQKERRLDDFWSMTLNR